MRFGKGNYLASGQKERMHGEEKGEGVKDEEEKRGHKEDEEVTARPSFREDGNKGKSRQRRQRRQREREEKRSPGVRQRKRGERLKEI